MSTIAFKHLKIKPGIWATTTELSTEIERLRAVLRAWLKKTWPRASYDRYQHQQASDGIDVTYAKALPRYEGHDIVAWREAFAEGLIEAIGVATPAGYHVTHYRHYVQNGGRAECPDLFGPAVLVRCAVLIHVARWYSYRQPKRRKRSHCPWTSPRMARRCR